MKTKIIIVNIIIIALFFIFTTTITLNPKGEILERKPEFKWLGFPTSYVIMIDDNPEFTTPITAQVKGKTYTSEESLELGEYYWKVKGLRNSQTQKFIINSKVSLKREEENLRNDGNTRLKLDLKPSITGAVILDINRTIKLGEETEEVSAKQDE
ncbi:MAG: hypothetical protein L6408_02500 [Nanoarchaeota archaeon]|nr:hypothetical protein [Nanoarchaeota archaeon]